MGNRLSSTLTDRLPGDGFAPEPTGISMLGNNLDIIVPTETAVSPGARHVKVICSASALSGGAFSVVLPVGLPSGTVLPAQLEVAKR